MAATHTWRNRPRTCGCPKLPWPDRAAAARYAAVSPDVYDGPVRLYTCPGTSVWHVATRGFHPDSLKTRPRIIAWHLIQRPRVDVDDLLRRDLRIEPYSSAWTKTLKVLTNMRRAGLTERQEVNGIRYEIPIDRPSLLSVCEVGWEMWNVEHGDAARAAVAARQPG